MRTAHRAVGAARRAWRLAPVAGALVLALAACGFLEDLVPPPKSPPEPLPGGSCRDLPLTPSGAAAVPLGTWAAPGLPSGELVASQVRLPVAAAAPAAAGTSPAGPGEWQNRYPAPRTYFGFACDGLVGAVWQSASAGEVMVALFSADLARGSSWSLPGGGERLLAATFGAGRLYYLTLAPGGTTEEEVAATLTLRAYTFGAPAESAAAAVSLDTSRQGLNMIASGDVRPWEGHSALAYSRGQLALVLSRLMHRSSDGLNHQGGVAATFDADTLTQTSLLGQTSGHSFGTYLTAAEGGGFLAIDHGDNYPRGVNLHRIAVGSKTSRVVYTFKTEHGTTATSPAGVSYPVYEEISGGGTTYYRWSNDNNVYGELGAVLEFDDGLLVVFVGEPDPDGRALRNERAAGYLTDPRDIGNVKVRADFQAAPYGEANVVTDDLVLSGGPGSVTESGGFYDFNGGWAPQRNAGLRWLTSYPDVDAGNASRLKAVRAGDDAGLLLWETWTPTTYTGTWFALVDKAGRLLTAPTPLGAAGAVRLARSDDPFVHDGSAYLFDGSGTDLVVTVVAGDL
ncbi:MAG: hypothetical protein H3C53_06205 [Trueperaceae bacterium]|nr:hypothetical protein [Trueperaceae bacterium]